MPRLTPGRRDAERDAAEVLDTETLPDEQVSDTARQVRALKLRLSGASYREIADRLGYGGPSGAYKAVSSELSRRLTEPADELRELELARLDRVQMSLWKLLTSVEVLPEDLIPATNAWIRLSKRRSDLLGLDAPKKIDITARVRELAIQEGLDPDQAELDAREAIAMLEAAAAGGGLGPDWRA